MSAAGARRAAALVLIAAVVATALALAPASRLEIEADLAALLPEGSAVADDYRRFLAGFSGLQKVWVVVRPADTEAAARLDRADLVAAVEKVAERIAASPEVAGVRAGLEPEDLEFFTRYLAPRAPLLVPRAEISALADRLEPEAVARRAARLRAALWSPRGSLEAHLATHDPLGLAASLLDGLAGPGTIRVDPLSTIFLSPAGDAALLVVTPASGEIDPEAGRRLAADLERAAAELATVSATPLALDAVGGPLYAAHDERIVRRDLERTLGTSVAACALLLAVSFEGLLLPLLVLAAIPAALIWTAAALAWSVGGVSAAAVGFAAVLVGLGVDYGIHGATRFRQLWQQLKSRAGGDGQEGELAGGALAATYRGVAPAILASALTTGGAFAVLRLAHFRPLRELGLAVAMGIAAMLVAAATAGLGLAWARPRAGWRPRPAWRLLGRAAGALARLGARRRRVVLAAAAAATLAGLAGFGRLTLDAGLESLRPADHPLLAAERQLVERFGVQVDTVTILVPGADLDGALAGAGRVAALLDRPGGPELQIRSPAQWLPAGDELAARLGDLAELPLARAADDLERELAAVGLDPAAFAPGLEALRALGRGEDPGAPPAAAWPPWLAELVHQETAVPPGVGPERSEREGRGAPAPGPAAGARAGPDGGTTWAALHVRLPQGGWPEGPPPDLRRAILDAAPGAVFASAEALGAELRALARRDLGTLGAAALGVVLAVVLVSFRGRPRPALLALVPVVLGTVWTLGAWGLAGGRLDLISLAVVPVLLGIGIDDGLHAVHAREAGGGRTMTAALDETGRAIGLTTLTTCVGFGSLVLSSLPGLRRGGLLLAAGVVACYAATLLVLPALAARREAG